MKSNTITTIKLVPDDGMYLTQKELGLNEERIFSDSVFCPSGQEDNWLEVTQEYKDLWEKEHPVLGPDDIENTEV